MLAIWDGAQAIIGNNPAVGGDGAESKGSAAPVGFFEGAIFWGDELMPATGPDLVTLRAWWRRWLQWGLAGLAGMSRALGG